MTDPTEASNAATASSNDDDETVAKKLLAIEQLTSVFGFDVPVAEAAIEAVGPEDITACYNYILDQNLGEDKGGPIVPIDNCPHIPNHVKLTFGKLPLMPADTTCQHRSAGASGAARAKEDTNQDGTCSGKENWLCLECGAIRCSRYVNGHGVVHWEETKEADSPGHCVAVSLSDLSVWCYVCSAYVRDPTLMPITRELEQRKHGDDLTGAFVREARSE